MSGAKARKRKRRTPYQLQKDRTWSAFSRFIRTRDCLDTTGDPERGRCFTCQREFEFAKLHAGHVVAGRNNALLFDERGCYAQCYRCNIGEHGKPHEARDYVVMLYGEAAFEELRQLRFDGRKFTLEELHEMQLDYQRRTEEMNA